MMAKLTVYQGSVPDKKTMNKSVFALSVHGWLAYISATHVPQMNTVIDEIDAAVLSIENFAQTAEESANAANLARDAVLVSVNSAQNAELAAAASAASAAASAASAAAIAGAFAGTSTTSLLIEIGSKTFSTQLGEQYTDGIWLTAVSAANATNWMYGQVTSYNATTGALVLNIQAIGGSGTFADWNLSLTGVRGAQGPAGATFTGGNLTSAINHSKASVASHATTANIWGALGNQIDWTGTATTTIFPNAPQAGATRELICSGACSFTAGANMLIDGVTSGSTIVCAAGDTVIVRAISTTQFKMTRIKVDGTAQVSPAGGFSNLVLLTTSGSWNVPSGVTTCKVTVIGGGGGGAAGDGSAYAGVGGHAGGVAIKYATVTPNSTIAYTIGAGGTRGTSGGAGSIGGTTSFNLATVISATGGRGGERSTSSFVAGMGANGNINIMGGCGGTPTRSSDGGYGASGGGNGGVNILGGNGNGGLPYHVTNTWNEGGSAALNSGAGGGGGNAGANGGGGGSGCIIIEY